MGVICYFLYRFLRSHTGNTLSLLGTIFVAVLSYFVSILLTGAVRREDLEKMPHGHIFIRAADKLHLLHK